MSFRPHVDGVWKPCVLLVPTFCGSGLSSVNAGEQATPGILLTPSSSLQSGHTSNGVSLSYVASAGHRATVSNTRLL